MTIHLNRRWIISDDGNCFLCGKPSADYLTHVAVDRAGHLRVDVHMTCLIEKGSTMWKSAETPQITDPIRDVVTDHGFLIVTSFYIQDHTLFRNDFPDLCAETMTIAGLLQRASGHGVVDPIQSFIGAYIWHGILRPVDYLVALRRLKGKVESENPWALYAQDTLL